MNSLEPTITPPSIVVASEVFGSAVHYNVNAILERSLIIGRGECVINDGSDSVIFPRFATEKPQICQSH